MSPVRVRFAPSPTGELHLGGARTALVNALFARSAGGSFVLRIEDTDAERNVPGAEARLEADLGWLGIHPDEGPGCGGPAGPYRQSERRASHLAAFDRLRESGRLYMCFCSAGGRVERGCPGGCRELAESERSRRLSLGDKPAFRFQLDHDARMVDDLLRGRVTFAGAPAPDPVILRADGRPTFLFAGAVDDAEQGITHVIRGEDHLPNAWKQVQMIGALGAPPPRYAHLPLILGEDRTPLSKRHGRTSVGALRDAGYLPEAVVLALAHLGMTAPEVTPGADPWPALVEVFSLGKLNRAAAVHDQGRLDFLSGAWMRALPADQLARRCAEFSPADALVADAAAAQVWWPEFIALVAASQTTLRDALAAGSALLSWRGAAPEPAPVLQVWRELWPADGVPSAERFGELSKEVSARAGVKGAALFHPLRLALTGAETGPALSRLAPLLDRAAAKGGARFEVASCAIRIARSIAGE